MTEVGAIDVAGLRIGFRRAGRGPGLVLLHGAYSDSRLWQRQLDQLSDEFTVVAWDAPGCGRSADPPPGFDGAALAGCLAAFIDGLDLRRPHLLGLSWGAGFALDLYRRRPGMACSLILASAYAGWAGSLPPEEVERRIAGVRTELGLTPELFVPAWIPTLLTERADPGLVAEVACLMSQFRPAGMRLLLELAGRADHRDVLPTVTVPTLLLYGAEDRRSPLSVAHDLRDRIPGAALSVVPAAGHLANLEAPLLFNGHLRHFLHTVEERARVT
jgi:pimeloyl-ACP methyl ester carboxylesterase